MIESLRVEKQALSGLLKNPEIFTDIDGIINEKSFDNQVNKIIFSVMRQVFFSDEKLDKVLIALKISNLGIKAKDGISIHDYLETFDATQITAKGTFDTCKELKKLQIRREVLHISELLREHAEKQGNLAPDAFIAGAENIFNSKINLYDGSEEFPDLFDGLKEMIEELGNNPVQETGLIIPFNELRRLIGGLEGGHVYSVCSRSGEGKTTLLENLAYKVGIINNVPIFGANTEMTYKQAQFRMASALTEVNTWLLKTGNWRKNKETTDKVRARLEGFKKVPFTYKHCGNRTIDEVCSMIRRWYLSKVGRGNPAIVYYDYLKLTGETIGKGQQEYQVLGEKVDKLKRLSEELNIPILTAVQANRSGENRGKNSKDVLDDSSIAAGSDRILHFTSFFAIFRRKTIDEIAQDGEEYGTHKMIFLKTRDQGEAAMGHREWVKRDGVWVRNFLNYSVENFNVTEKGSLQDIIDYHSHKISPAQLGKKDYVLKPKVLAPKMETPSEEQSESSELTI